MAAQLCLTSGDAHPKAAASSRIASPNIAAVCMSFFGMQPTLTQVPPKPHFVPCGLGFT